MRRALPRFHVFTGCDSTSAFAGKRKLTCLKILESDEIFLDAFFLLGEQHDVNETVGETLEEFTYRIYGKKSSVLINEARYEVFRKKKAMADPHMLPSSQDALKTHIARANFQTMEWKNALSQHSAHLNLNNDRWRMTDESIEIRWMNQKPAPEILGELTSSCCKKSKCRNKICKFKAAELLCTDLCPCFACENNGSGEDHYELSDEDEDGEITDDDDGESELDDDRELSGIDNSDEDE